MWSFFFSPIGRWISGALAALGILAGAFLAGWREGRQGAAQRAREADIKRADQIRSKADEARANPSSGSPDERLRERGHLRD